MANLYLYLTVPLIFIRMTIHRGLRHLRQRLATGHAPFDLAVMGLLAGLLAGTLVLGFRIAFEWCATLLYPDIPGVNRSPRDVLSLAMIFLVPAVGATLIGLAISLVPRPYRQTGLAHVTQYVSQKDGNLPWQNALVQFFGGLACFLTGQSVGREGPSVHLGVAVNSLVGQFLRLPHNTLRILAGCGTAAAIAASFNTPIAGVIFAMEVVLAEYTIAGFTPVILAAVAGTAVTRAVYGAAPFLPLQTILAPGLWDLGFVLLLGLIVAAASACFVSIQTYCLRFNSRPIWIRLAMAGIITGSLALVEPRILGSGYFSMEQLLHYPLFPLTLATMIITKLIATACSIGLGMPGGMISPNFFIGACIGALVGYVVNTLAPDVSGSITLYALLGMGAMMGAILNAPLAALMALMELTYSPNIIFPGLLAITTANICHRELFSQPSAIDAALRQQGVQLRQDPIKQALQSQAVSSLMDADVDEVRPSTTAGDLRAAVRDEPNWILVADKGEHHVVDLVALAELLDDDDIEDAAPLELLELKLTSPIATIDTRANLNEAWQTMLRTGNDTVCVRSKHAYLLHSNIGIITRKALETHIYHRYGATQQ